MEVAQTSSAYTGGRTSQSGTRNTTPPCAQEAERQKDTTLLGLSWRLTGLTHAKHGAQKSTDPLATCYVRFPIATIIVTELNEFKIFGGQ